MPGETKRKRSRAGDESLVVVWLVLLLVVWWLVLLSAWSTSCWSAVQAEKVECWRYLRREETMPGERLSSITGVLWLSPVQCSLPLLLALLLG